MEDDQNKERGITSRGRSLQVHLANLEFENEYGCQSSPSPSPPSAQEQEEEHEHEQVQEQESKNSKGDGEGEGEHRHHDEDVLLITAYLVGVCLGADFSLRSKSGGGGCFSLRGGLLILFPLSISHGILV